MRKTRANLTPVFGTCAGRCKDGAQGVGYYRDSGPAEMSEEVLRQLKAFEAQPPPPKHLNDTGGILTVGEEEVRSHSPARWREKESIDARDDSNLL